MNEPLVAVGIGNTTITIGVTECQVDGDALRPDVDTSLGQLTSGFTSENDGYWRWSRQLTVETNGFDPAALSLDVPQRASWQVASVHRASEQRLAEWLRAAHPHATYRKLTVTDLPIKVCVDQPERVGMDRLVAAVAVNCLRDPDRPAIIVDAGTAITVDLVNARGDFCGGAILPGIRLVAQALAAKTDQLPEVDSRFHDPLPDVLGKSTESAIRSGLFWGSVGAIRELIERIGASTTGPPQLFLTGGDASRLAPFIASDAMFVRDLVIGGVLSVNANRC